MKVINYIFGISSLVLVSGCGGGGGSSSPVTTTTVVPTTTISGTVPGTLIEAFCKDGSYFSINSTDDGTSNHPFSLSLPVGLNCKFVMTTNENDVNTTKRIVTPIILNDLTTTSTYFEISNDVDIGYVPLSLTNQGVQTPLSVTVTDNNLKVNSFSYDPLDIDNDGIPNMYEDDDGDGLTNKHDDDDDNDGISDALDPDHNDDDDGDGILDIYDDDDDNDGIPDYDDDDDDNDGVHDDHDNDHDDDTESSSVNITLPTSYAANDGRLLGSQCAQCHGTNGYSTNSWDSIAREDNLASEIFDDDPIMNAQAHGYTATEITLIGNWLKTQ